MNDDASADRQPVAELDAPYSSQGATATDWARTSDELDTAEIFWLSTVRADGRPHVTPVIAVWAGGAMHFCTGPEEQKAKNIAANAPCAVITGTNEWRGLDVIVEGVAEPLTDHAELQELAGRYEAKYGSDWHFDVADGAFAHDAGQALVFRVAPSKVWAYERDEPGGATRYRF